MSQKANLIKIEEEARSLSTGEKLTLVEHLIHELREKTEVKEKNGKNISWDDIYGTGKHLWKDEDAQDYVNKMREDRN